MSFSITSLGESAPRVVVDGSLDCATMSVLRIELSALLGFHPALVELDLSCLRFVDGPGLGLLLSFIKRLYAQGGTLMMPSPDEQPLALTELLRLAQVRESALSR